MNCLTLFSNIGIDEIFLKEVGINVVVANELEKDRADLYQRLHPDSKMIQGDITDKEIFTKIVNQAKAKKCELIIATPPCQGMSIANAVRSKKNDPRNSLIKNVVQIIKKVKPKYVLIENVPGMEKTFIKRDDEKINDLIEHLSKDISEITPEQYNTINIMDYIKKKLPKYHIESKVLNSADYETPQNRKRLIVLLSQNKKWVHPDRVTDPHITVEKAIGHLQSLEAGESSKLPWHSGKKAGKNHIEWMRHTATGKSAFSNEGINEYYPHVIINGTQRRTISGFQTTYKRIDWDRPAPTIGMTNGAINSQNNVHPGRLKPDGTYSDARVLSVRELLILCGIPDNYFDDYTDLNENFLRKVIGECFPPKFCREIIKTLPNPNNVQKTITMKTDTYIELVIFDTEGKVNNYEL